MKQTRNIDSLLVVLMLISTFWLPHIPTGEGLPAFRIEDVLLPIVAFRIWQLRPPITLYVKGVALFAVYIFFVIVMNNRITAIRDYFEILKLAKYIVFFLFFSLETNIALIKKLIIPIFIGIVIFNSCQYFNLFNFNETIEPFYSSEHQLKMFGRNSDATVTTKRLLGTFGNPNNNGLLFLLFAVIFMPLKQEATKGQTLLYLIAVTGSLHCQSRTVFVALALLFLIHFIVKFSIVKKHLILFIPFIVFIIADVYFDNILYLEALFDTRITGFETNNASLQGRFEIWQQLWDMIVDKPLIGHAPYKEYFYDNQLYPENEFIFITWQYGFIGLTFYLFYVCYPFIKNLKNIRNEKNIIALLLVASILFSALTNTPLSEPRYLVIFAIITALFTTRKTGIET